MYMINLKYRCNPLVDFTAKSKRNRNRLFIFNATGIDSTYYLAWLLYMRKKPTFSELNDPKLIRDRHQRRIECEIEALSNCLN